MTTENRLKTQHGAAGEKLCASAQLKSIKPALL